MDTLIFDETFCPAKSAEICLNLIEQFNARGPYPPHKLEAMQRQMLRMLSARLKLSLDRQRHPPIGNERIDSPIFIAG